MKRKENKDLMMQMLRDGVPYKEIAEATGYKATSLHRYAQDIEERKEHQNTGVKSYKDLIIRWFEQGKTAEEIVKKKVYDAVYPYLLPTGWLSRKVGVQCDHKCRCDCL